MKNIDNLQIESLLLDDQEKRLFEQFDYEIINNCFKEIITKSKHAQGLFSKLINRARRKKYPDKKFIKYGNVSRSLEPKQIQSILNLEKNEKIRLAFELMYKLGLRESEIVEIKTEHIYQDWKIKIINVKAKREETLIVPKSIRDKIKNFMEENKQIIKEKQNYLFYSSNPVQKRNNLSKDWLRGHFRKLSIKSGLNYVYAKSEEPEKDCNDKKRVIRNLYQYCLHSLRHSFCNIYYDMSGFDIVKTSQAMRHTNIKTTMRYIFRNQNAIFSVLEEM